MGCRKAVGTRGPSDSGSGGVGEEACGGGLGDRREGRWEKGCWELQGSLSPTPGHGQPVAVSSA